MRTFSITCDHTTLRDYFDLAWQPSKAVVLANAKAAQSSVKVIAPKFYASSLNKIAKFKLMVKKATIPRVYAKSVGASDRYLPDKRGAQVPAETKSQSNGSHPPFFSAVKVCKDAQQGR